MTEAEAVAKIKAALSSGGPARLVLIVKPDPAGGLLTEVFGPADTGPEELTAAAFALETISGRMLAQARLAARN